MEVFKYSAGTLGRIVDRHVVTLTMQALCDAISKTGKVQMNHWGESFRHPMSPFLLAVVPLNPNEGRDTWSSGQTTDGRLSHVHAPIRQQNRWRRRWQVKERGKRGVHRNIYPCPFSCVELRVKTIALFWQQCIQKGLEENR